MMWDILLLLKLDVTAGRIISSADHGTPSCDLSFVVFAVIGSEIQISNLKSQISNFKSQISNLKSQISNLKSQISNNPLI